VYAGATMDTRRVLLAPFRAIWRFLDWVYAPDARSGPTRGQATVHMRAAGLGQDSTRWMGIEEAERRRRAAEIRRVR
jgi:ribosomal protein L13E